MTVYNKSFEQILEREAALRERSGGGAAQFKRYASDNKILYEYIN